MKIRKKKKSFYYYYYSRDKVELKLTNYYTIFQPIIINQKKRSIVWIAPRTAIATNETPISDLREFPDPVAVVPGDDFGAAAVPLDVDGVAAGGDAEPDGVTPGGPPAGGVPGAAFPASPAGALPPAGAPPGAGAGAFPPGAGAGAGAFPASPPGAAGAFPSPPGAGTLLSQI
ncbi:unnamed protein product [Rhizophagus irregularis]|nr:unnamed protein product [Rhizophagus irregularis]